LGIFGFLSSAYQKSSSEFGIYTSKIEVIEQQKKYVIDQMDQEKNRIDSLIKNRNAADQRLTEAQSLVGKSILASQLLKLQTQTNASIAEISKNIATENTNLQTLQTKEQDFDQQIVDLKANSQTSKDIITFQFIADAVGLPLNTVVKYFILVIIIVFDPLAVGLVLAYNTAIYGSWTQDNKEKQIIHEVEKLVEVPVDRIVEKIKEIPIEKIVEVPVEKIVEKIVEVPVDRIVETRVEVPVEKIVTNTVEVPVEKIIEVIKI
jgi:hypothetical protein